MAAEVELLLVHGRLYQTIAGVERRRRFIDLSPSLLQLLLVQNSLALVDLATRQGERDPELYQLVVQWLEFMCAPSQLSDERAGFLLGSFTLKLMDVSGYRPELVRCLSCHDPVVSGGFRWHALKGGVVCISCTQKNEEQWFSARPMNDETLKLLRFSLNESFQEHLRPHLRAEHLACFHEALESYLVSHFPTIPAVSIRGACTALSLA